MTTDTMRMIDMRMIDSTLLEQLVRYVQNYAASVQHPNYSNSIIANAQACPVLHAHPTPTGVYWTTEGQEAGPEVKEKSRSQKMRDAGFTKRDTRLTCDECGAKFTPQFAPLHECPPAPQPQASPQAPVAYMWTEAWMTPDSPNGPAEYDSEQMFSLDPPSDEAIAVTPLYERPQPQAPSARMTRGIGGLRSWRQKLCGLQVLANGSE